MAFSGRFETRHDDEEDFNDNGESDLDYDSDSGSSSDPSYSILKETDEKLSKLSIKKKPKLSAGIHDDVAPIVSIADGNDEEDIDQVLKIIKAGKLEKLKVEQCKAYLRKNGLRLTGNKDTLIKRINEHLEILNGGGENKYPESSFTVNCKGDACTGDVVMFEQKVYEMYNIASRSSIGPSCGTRIVAGRIVKESYGASKQQHTFTIEVLWSKGERPLPPLHPLLIKGRNLYRMKTLRQSWKDEGERQKALMEKHTRGSLARSNRDARVLEKEKRKTLQKNRISRKENVRDNSSQSNPTSAGIELAGSMEKLFIDSRKQLVKHQPGPQIVRSGNLLQPQQSERQTIQHLDDDLRNSYWNQASHNEYGSSSLNIRKHINQGVPPLVKVNPLANYKQPNSFRGDHSASVNKDFDRYNTNRSNGLSDHRMPLNNMNLYHIPRQQSYKQQQQCQQQRCHYYSQGRCYFGENCKFSHE